MSDVGREIAIGCSLVNFVREEGRNERGKRFRLESQRTEGESGRSMVGRGYTVVEPRGIESILLNERLRKDRDAGDARRVASANPVIRCT